MPGRRTAARRGRSRGAGLRALLALVVLLALCVGIPVALVALAPISFPHGVPSPAELVSSLTRRDDGTLFLAALTLAAWAGWATFAVAVLLEIPAQLRGVPAVRVRGLGVQQSLAGGLVAAVLAMVLVPAAAGAAVRSPAYGATASGPAAASVTAVTSAAPSAGPSQAEAAEPAAPPGLPASSGKVHVVKAEDTLWDLAVRYLGDGSQWRRIAALNYDRAQPGGCTSTVVTPCSPGGAWSCRPCRRPCRTGATTTSSGAVRRCQGSRSTSSATPRGTRSLPGPARTCSSPTADISPTPTSSTPAGM